LNLNWMDNRYNADGYGDGDTTSGEI